MNLRSGAYYRLGHCSVSNGGSKASTLGSTSTRTPSLSNQVDKRVNGETLLDSSMDTTYSTPSQLGLDLEYDGRLRFVLENNHGTLIYRDFINCHVVKMEDHITIFDLAPWVNFQGDRYMGKDGSMYMLTENPKEVDKLGNSVQ